MSERVSFWERGCVAGEEGIVGGLNLGCGRETVFEGGLTVRRDEP